MKTQNQKNSYLFTLCLSIIALILLSAPLYGPISTSKKIDKTTASTTTTSIHLEYLSSYHTGIFAQSAAESVAYSERTYRLFVTNVANNTVDVISIKNPSSPSLLFSINLSAYGHKPNSVAVGQTKTNCYPWNALSSKISSRIEPLVAVAIENETKTEPGCVVFFDEHGTYLNHVTVGAVPDMLTFTPDMTKILVANEGEPEDYFFGNDPEGSISIIHLEPPTEYFGSSIVNTIGFTAFNNATIDPQIRIYGPDATVAQDLEPEYITVSADSKTAWVSLQENNALAVVDLVQEKITRLIPLGYKNHSGDHRITNYEFKNMPVIGITHLGQHIKLGGFSGLFYEGINPQTGRLQFITHTDRGPTCNQTDVDGDGLIETPFVLPLFQPRWIRFELSPETQQCIVTETIPLTRGKPPRSIFGLPNLHASDSSQGFAYYDERPVNIRGFSLPLVPYGNDFEGIVRVPDGTYWMVEEYRPSLCHFNAQGNLLKRFIPQGTNNHSARNLGVEALPAVYAQHTNTRGFAAIAYDNGKLYAFMQDALDNPDTQNEHFARKSLNVRILEFDIATETTTAEYLYRLDSHKTKNIGDAVALGNGSFLVLEYNQTSSNEVERAIYRINLAGATNLQTLTPQQIEYPYGSIENMTGLPYWVQQVRRELFVDLTNLGYTCPKPQGLARIDDHTVAVINDNSYGLSGSWNPNTGWVQNTQEPTILSIIRFNNTRFDGSDRDKTQSHYWFSSVMIRPWPVYGMYQPDGIASYQVYGKTYIVTANEGDAREWSGCEEAQRVKSAIIDPAGFNNLTQLKLEKNLGRLKITSKTGDTDGDGDLDELYTFGARSFSILDEDGHRIYDSGEDFELITAQRYPFYFNSDNDENPTFDKRSDDKGPEPEGVCIGTIGQSTYAFICLERVGGIMVYDISNPFAPRFVDYVNNRNFTANPHTPEAGDLGPEIIYFISEERSPIHQPLLVMANEVSGSTSIYLIQRT